VRTVTRHGLARMHGFGYHVGNGVVGMGEDIWAMVSWRAADSRLGTRPNPCAIVGASHRPFSSFQAFAAPAPDPLVAGPGGGRARCTTEL